MKAVQSVAVAVEQEDEDDEEEVELSVEVGSSGSLEYVGSPFPPILCR
jgi:hypothetical protein